MNFLNKIKLIAMDLDGTLTQHKSMLGAENRAALNKLASKYKLLMLGAGDVKRIFTQMNFYPIDIIGNYGMQEAQYNPLSAELEIIREGCCECDHASVDSRISMLRQKLGCTDYSGDNAEFHDSGVVTFPLLGTMAPLSEKLSFDPDRAFRRSIYSEVRNAFPDYNVFIGGSSSFDFAPKPYNKYYALKCYCRQHNISSSELIYLGDDYGSGGNDECIYNSEFEFIKVDDYRTFPEKIKCLL